MSIKKINVTDHKEIHEIIKKADSCSLAMIDENNLPYVIPMNFGFKNNVFYFHSSPEGMKMDILKKHPDVCICLSIMHELNIRHETVACSYSMKYKSVVAYGKMEFIEEDDLKREYMNIIMGQYTDRTDFKYSDPAIRNVAIMKVEVNKIYAHNRGY